MTNGNIKTLIGELVKEVEGGWEFNLSVWEEKIAEGSACTIEEALALRLVGAFLRRLTTATLRWTSLRVEVEASEDEASVVRDTQGRGRVVALLAEGVDCLPPLGHAGLGGVVGELSSWVRDGRDIVKLTMRRGPEEPHGSENGSTHG